MKKIQLIFILLVFISCSTNHSHCKVKRHLTKSNPILEKEISLNTQNNLGGVSGKIIDRNTNEGIGYTIIVLTNKLEQRFINTDVEGNFVIDDLKGGNYKVVITFVGYENVIINNLHIERGNMTFIKIGLCQQSF